MHLKALQLLAILCIHAIGVLAAPMNHPGAPPPPPPPSGPPPTHHDAHVPADWRSYGNFHPANGMSIGHEYAQHVANTQAYHNALRQHYATNPHAPPPAPPAPPHHFLGEGRDARVFRVPHPVQDQHGEAHHAVVKVFHPSHGALDRNDFRNEVDNLKRVNQYLGHGYHAPTGTHYIVQKNMGGALPPGVHPDHVKAMNDEAKERYKTQFGMTQNDEHGGNYVYHNRNGHPQAEIIDWSHGTHTPPQQSGSSWGGFMGRFGGGGK